MRAVTIADVAKHAGVAVSTVSYVLSGKRAISAMTRQRVLSSVRTLGYHPNAGARALGMRHIWLTGEPAPAAGPCCPGDAMIHSLAEVEALLS